MLIKWVIGYGDIFRDFFVRLALISTSGFCRQYHECMYAGLVHYGFVTLCENYSHLILEHVFLGSLKISLDDKNMMSCTRLYVDPTESPMGQAGKKSLLRLLKTGSSPRYPRYYHSMVYSKNNSYFVGIKPLLE